MGEQKRIWVWPFNAGWGGGYWRSKTQAPETEVGGFWAVPEDVVADRIEALEADVATALKAMGKVEAAMTAWNKRQDKPSFDALGEALDQMNMARAQLTGIPR